MYINRPAQPTGILFLVGLRMNMLNDNHADLLHMSKTRFQLLHVYHMTTYTTCTFYSNKLIINNKTYKQIVCMAGIICTKVSFPH